MQNIVVGVTDATSSSKTLQSCEVTHDVFDGFTEELVAAR